jgi:hypothetical protein
MIWWKFGYICDGLKWTGSNKQVIGKFKKEKNYNIRTREQTRQIAIF